MTNSVRFAISRVFKAPRDRVWQAWTQPDQLAQWFGPKDTSGAILAFDLRPGGEWRGRMDAPDGSVMYSKFVFQAVEPMARLVWVHGFADATGNRIRAPFAAQFPLELLTTVLFADVAGGTRVDLSWEPINPTPEEAAFFASMMESMKGGWSGSFGALDDYLGGV
jgi:uncharacterized protein YndB with AHSA1/START domain